MRCAARLLLALLGTSLFSCGALAQAYPAKPLRLIVPDAAGILAAGIAAQAQPDGNPFSSN